MFWRLLIGMIVHQRVFVFCFILFLHRWFFCIQDLNNFNDWTRFGENWQCRFQAVSKKICGKSPQNSNISTPETSAVWIAIILDLFWSSDKYDSWDHFYPLHLHLHLIRTAKWQLWSKILSNMPRSKKSIFHFNERDSAGAILKQGLYHAFNPGQYCNAAVEVLWASRHKVYFGRETLEVVTTSVRHERIFF